MSKLNARDFKVGDSVTYHYRSLETNKIMTIEGRVVSVGYYMVTIQVIAGGSIGSFSTIPANDLKKN